MTLYQHDYLVNSFEMSSLILKDDRNFKLLQGQSLWYSSYLLRLQVTIWNINTMPYKLGKQLASPNSCVNFSLISTFCKQIIWFFLGIWEKGLWCTEHLFSIPSNLCAAADFIGMLEMMKCFLSEQLFG